MSNTITTLPEDTFLHCFSFLRLKDVAKALPTCRHFRRTANAIFEKFFSEIRKLNHFTYAEYSKFSFNSLHIPENPAVLLDKMTSLRSLSLRLDCRPRIDLEAIFESRILSQLTDLSICGETAPSFEICTQIAATCPNLTSLTLGWNYSLPDAQTRALTSLKQLQRVSFQECDIAGSTTQTLASMPSVTDVCLFGCQNIRAGSIRNLLRSPHIVRLDVGGSCGGVTAAAEQAAIGFAIAEDGRSIKHLSVKTALYSCASLVAIARRCESLVSIDLHNWHEDIVGDPETLDAAMKNARPGAGPGLKIGGLLEGPKRDSEQD
jgi:hypothetical protein